LGVLAIFPAIAALVTHDALVADPQQVADPLAAARPQLPSDVFAMLADQVEALVTAPSAKLGVASIVSFLLLLWSARAGVSAPVEALNIVGSRTDHSGMPRRRERRSTC
jgi:membrane protein